MPRRFALSTVRQNANVRRHIHMQRIHRVPDDFEAVIRIFTTAEGGRATPAANGIRWAFAYAENQPAGELYDIFPDFFDEKGDSLPTDKPLPVGRELPAR